MRCQYLDNRLHGKLGKSYVTLALLYFDAVSFRPKVSALLQLEHL
jgi:hypothetical protein